MIDEDADMLEQEGDDLDKEFYRINEVAEMLGVSMPTLRFWEKEFPEAAPVRTPSRTRLYTPDNVRLLRIIQYLVRVKGLRLDAVRQQLRTNRANVSRRMEVIHRLESLREDLNLLLHSLKRRK